MICIVHWELIFFTEFQTFYSYSLALKVKKFFLVIWSFCSVFSFLSEKVCIYLGILVEIAIFMNYLPNIAQLLRYLWEHVETP